MSKITDAFAPYLPLAVLGVLAYLFSKRITDSLCGLPGNPLGCAKTDEFGCNNETYWCESKKRCIPLKDSCCTLNPVSCTQSGMDFDPKSCTCISKPIKNNPQFIHAQMLVGYLNKGQCANAEEASWMQINEPTLYNLFRERELFCKVNPPPIVIPHIPGYTDMCYGNDGTPLRVPKGMNCHNAKEDMCSRGRGIPSWEVRWC